MAVPQTSRPRLARGLESILVSDATDVPVGARLGCPTQPLCYGIPRCCFSSRADSAYPALRGRVPRLRPSSA